jgi:hypothetical protein
VISLDIRPFEGALPITFGMPRGRVIEILGNPDFSNKDGDNWGTLLEINIGYDQHGVVDHIGLGGRGDNELRFEGQILWSSNQHPDPNPTFLAFDPEPLERVGFLYFTKLGIATTGYHDDDPHQQAISIYPRGAKDEFLLRAKKPGLDKYKPVGGVE